MTSLRWSRRFRRVRTWLPGTVVCIAAVVVLGVAGAQVTVTK